VDEVFEKSVGRVIETMREKLGEQLSIDEMARTAMFSKFHFSRIFQRVTGVSPGRFLWAMRIQRAKQLLLTSSLNVTEISHTVGYTSVGTFSSRFSSAVGISPSVYRRLGGYVPQTPAEDQPAAAERPPPVVTGDVSATPDDDADLIFVGLFADRMPQGRPASSTLLARPGPFVLSEVPHGTWYLLAHSIAVNRDATGGRPGPAGEPRSIGVLGPIEVRQDTTELPAVRLRPVRAVDAPVLLAPPDVRLIRACGGR
jgi:AraC-like DNA-binding protein